MLKRLPVLPVPIEGLARVEPGRTGSGTDKTGAAEKPPLFSTLVSPLAKSAAPDRASELTLKADIEKLRRDVCFVPNSEVARNGDWLFDQLESRHLVRAIEDRLFGTIGSEAYEHL